MLIFHFFDLNFISQRLFVILHQYYFNIQIICAKNLNKSE
jgi:hypothetical protein